MEIHGEPGNEGILDIIDDDGELITRDKLKDRETEWLLETWSGALEEVARIVGSKEYENKLDFKEKGNGI